MRESLTYEVGRAQHFMQKLEHLARCRIRLMVKNDNDAHEYWEALEEIRVHLDRIEAIARAVAVPTTNDRTNGSRNHDE